MDVTSCMFSEGEESLQTESLREKIKLISKQLNFDSPSPLNLAINRTPCNSPVFILHAGDKHIEQLDTGSPLFSFSSLNHSNANKTIVLPPPDKFRDNSNAFPEQDVPFDLSTGSALDLRITREAERPVSTQPTHQPDISTKAIDSQLFGEDTIAYPIHHVGASTDKDGHSVSNESCSELQTSMTPNGENALHDHKHSHSVKPGGSRTQKKSTSTSSVKETPVSTLETNDSASTTLFIDNAFDYLKDMPGETSQSTSVNANLNQTYVCQPMVWGRPPIRRQSKTCNSKGVSASIDVHPDNSGSQKKESEISSLDSSLFTSVTSISSDAATSVWSVKNAVTTLDSSLTLTLTKTPATSANTFRTTLSQGTRCLVPNDRVVVGCNTSREDGATVKVKEASQTTSNITSTFMSFPATPNISFSQATPVSVTACEKSKEKMLSSTPRKSREEPIGSVATTSPCDEESLRRKLLKKKVTQKQESDSESVLNLAFSKNIVKSSPVKRKKKSFFNILKKQLLCNNAGNVSALSQHNQTVSATCMGRVFNNTPSKHVKSSNASSKKKSPKFPTCTGNINTTSASISFVTLNGSSSAPISDWCQQIISTTSSNIKPRPITTPREYTSQDVIYAKSSSSKSVGISTTSSPIIPKHSSSQQKQKTFDSTAFSCDLSQINSYHTPTKDTTCSSLAPAMAMPQGPSKEKKTSSRGSLTSVKAAYHTFSPQGSDRSSAPVTFGPEQVKHVNHWMALSTYDSQIDLIGHVGKLIAEFLVTFINDKDMRMFQSRFDLQPNRNVLIELCQLCNIKIIVSGVDSALLTLKKTSLSRAPTDADVKRLVRCTRR